MQQAARLLQQAARLRKLLELCTQSRIMMTLAILSENSSKNMRYNKTFTIAEAKKLVPRVRKMIVDANDELDKFSDQLEEANREFQEVESDLATIKIATEGVADLTRLRECRARFQERSQKLSTVQHDYVDCMNKWVDEITDLGIVLRDLRSGLLDFPAEKGDFQYLLCWRLDDKDIDYWHLPNDGFIGRRPLAVLDEYF